MRSALIGLAVALALAGSEAAVAADDGAREAAVAFGRALMANDASALMPILPQQGRVHLALIRLGPEEGRFGASQVVALFRDFLATGKFVAFEVVRLESDGSRSALAHGKAAIVDRNGRAGRVGLHLALEAEGSRWVLREVKETGE